MLIRGKERMLGPAIPMRDNYIMFDVEGMPPHLDELEKIYLWGMQVYGKRLITSKKPTSTSTSNDMAILGTAARVLRNLLDLLPVTRNAIALPLPSYSLKVVEEYVGFKRTQDEYGGSRAMAQFILATETDDEAERNARMAEIFKYNEKDLAATWAVFEWLRGRASAALAT